MIQGPHRPTELRPALGPLAEPLDAIRHGRAVAVVGPAERGFEAWLAMAAQFVTPQAVELMRRVGAGPISLCLPAGSPGPLARPRGGVDPSTVHAQATLSAAELAGAVQGALRDPDGRRESALPLSVSVAGRQGVLGHPGHAEAAVDLVRLAEILPAATICRIALDGHSPPSRARVEDLCRRWGLPVVSIRDLLWLRTTVEDLIDKVVETELPTPYGTFRAVGFEEKTTGRPHMALVNGDVRTAEAVLVAVHSRCLYGDVLQSLGCGCAAALDVAMRRIAAEARGVVLYLAPGDPPEPVGTRDAPSAGCRPGGWQASARNAIAAQLLCRLGVTAARVIATEAWTADEAGRELGVRVVEAMPVNSTGEHRP